VQGSVEDPLANQSGCHKTLSTSSTISRVPNLSKTASCHPLLFCRHNLSIQSSSCPPSYLPSRHVGDCYPLRGSIPGYLNRSSHRLQEQQSLPTKMDVVLEIFDTFLFDRAYALAFPVSASTVAYNAAKAAMNASAPSIPENPTAYYNEYHFQPASKYFTLEPSSWAYRTSWPRDDLWRQFLSLYLITA
jgi:hypothetical protein